MRPQDSKKGIFPMPVDDTISEGMPDLARPNAFLFSFLRSAGLCFRSSMLQKVIVLCQGTEA